MSPRPSLSTQPERSPKEVPLLSEPYRRAHTHYVLTSALLGSWELIGITLDTKGKWGIEFKSPRAVPIILVILVFYFGYKMVIEWLQCGAEENKFATLDYWIAHLIAVGAILIAVVQYLTKRQIVDFLFYAPERRVIVEEILFCGIVVCLFVSLEGIRGWKNVGGLKRSITVLAIAIDLFLVLASLVVVTGHQRYSLVFGALAAGALLSWLCRFLLSRTQIAGG